jgi:tetratricopeptide (TPR) repeat protein
MRAIRWMASILLLAVLSLSYTPSVPAQDSAAAGGAQPKYTMAEYNSYQAAAAEKNPASQIKLLDDFVAKYPNSALLNYIYPLYYKNYYGQKNYPKAIEYADKMIAMGDKISPAERYDAHYVRAYAFNSITNPDPDTAKAARAAALAALKVLDQLPKPDGEDDAKFAAEKKQSLIVFNGTAATAGMAAKDYAGAI